MTAGEGTAASLDVLTQQGNALNQKVDALEAELAKQTPRRLDRPQPANPFIVDEQPSPDGVLDTIAVNLPPATDISKVTMVYRKTSQTAGHNKEETWDDIKDAEAAVQHVERQMKTPLENGVEYGLAALIVKGDFVSTLKSRNPDPPDDVNFLTTWTTGAFFSRDPSKPDLGLILENKFDDVTKAFDAFVVVRIYAPINGIVTAYTGTVTINGTVTIVGTQTFVGQVAVGMLISVSSQTRKVTNVATNTITVDLPMRGSGSGLELDWGTPHTWDSGMVVSVHAIFRLTDDPNAQRLPAPPRVITDDEAATNSIDFRISGFVAARKYDWVQNILIGKSGRRHVFPASTQTFIAGGFTDATAGIPELTSVSFVYDATEPYNANQRHVKVLATQPNPPVALERAELRRFAQGAGTVQISAGVLLGTGTAFTTDLRVGDQVIVTLSGQTVVIANVNSDTNATLVSGTNTGAGQNYYISHDVLIEKNLRRAKYTPATGGQITIAWGDLKTKKLLTHVFRMTIFAQNAASRIVDSQFTVGGVGDLQEDTAGPVLSTGVTPILDEYFGAFLWACPVPALNIQTLDNYQVILSTQSTPPAGDPTVGVDNVQKIKYGQAGGFKRKVVEPHPDVWIFYRAHNKFNGGTWSGWSNGSEILGGVIQRPLKDSIATELPILPLGLERSATAPGSPTVANDSTHFSIDTSASAVTDFYIGDVLEVDSLPAADNVREITAYDATNHRLTVTPAFGAVPADSLAFLIHRGISNNADTTQIVMRGNKAGTQVDASHLVLDAGANTTTDFYVGWSAYVPSLAGADQVRRVTAYNATTKSCALNLALSGTPTSGIGFILFKGNVGHANVDLTGTISGLPFRIWIDGSRVWVEIILPFGAAAFSLTTIEFENWKLTGTRVNFIPQAMSAGPVLMFDGTTNNRSCRIRVRNDYRGSVASPVDGYSGYSSYARTPRPDDVATTYPGFYDPGATPPPPQPDPRGPKSYPSDLYPTF